MVKPSVVLTPDSYRGVASSIATVSVAWVLLFSATSAMAQDKPSAEPVAGDKPDATTTTTGEAAGEVNSTEAATTDGSTDGATGSEETSEASASVDASASTSSDVVVDTSGGGGLFEAASSGELTSSTSTETPQRFELSGYVRGTAFMGKIPEYRQGYMQAAYGEASLQLRTKRTEYGDAFAETRFRYGMQGGATKYEAELREGYVNAYLGPVDVRLGQQIIVWGKADGFNPTNNLTPTNLSIRSPHDDDRRVGNFASRVFLNLEPVRLEGVWVPLYRAVELPPFVYPKYVVEGSTTYPKPEFLRGTYAGKLHLNLAAIDMSFSYLYGHALLPGLTLQQLTSGDAIAPGGEPEVRISRTAYKQHVIGFDFSTTLGESFGLRGEAAYRMPLHYARLLEAPRPDVQYTLGLDTSFGDVSVIAQYLGRYTMDWQKDGPETPTDSDQLWSTGAGAAEPQVLEALAGTNQMLFQQLAEIQHLASLRLAWTGMHDSLNISALGLVNFTTKEWAAIPKLGYKLDDTILLSLGGEMYSGPPGTLLGLIDSVLSAGFVELKVFY
jgi:hypothetical protein